MFSYISVVSLACRYAFAPGFEYDRLTLDLNYDGKFVYILIKIQLINQTMNLHLNPKKLFLN